VVAAAVCRWCDCRRRRLRKRLRRRVAAEGRASPGTASWRRPQDRQAL
jgi:hypothetical protein